MLEYNKEIKIVSSTLCGYKIFCDSHHPLADKKGRVYYHRHLYSIYIGRWVTTSEVVHHIDGNKLNNDIGNLMLLNNKNHGMIENAKRYGKIDCPACNKEKSPEICVDCAIKETPVIRCVICGCEIMVAGKTSMCMKCYSKSKRRFNPLKEELQELADSMPMSKIAKFYGVSDRSIAKRCKLLDIKTYDSGHFLKKTPRTCSGCGKEIRRESVSGLCNNCYKNFRKQNSKQK